jgi:hypothetical protein
VRDFDADRERAIREAIARFEDAGQPVPDHLVSLLPADEPAKQESEPEPEAPEHKAEEAPPEKVVPRPPGRPRKPRTHKPDASV